jgi:thiamine biosynthesis lipoprotein ApbE
VTVDGVVVSSLLAELVGPALQGAADTGGSVDPTLTADLAGWGSDRPAPDSSISKDGW